MKHLLSTVLVLAALAFPALADSPAKAGQPMPSLAAVLPGASLPSTSGKVVLVDFWASWCGPCKASFPCLNKLHQTYASKGLVIVGVGVDDKAEDYKKFATKLGASFTIVHDSSHKCAAAFAPPTMPTSYLIDRKGVIRHIHKGFKGAKTEAEYIAEIEALLAEKK